MIVDLARFVETERPYWKALEETLDWLERSPGRALTLEEAERFHLLYQRTAADLGRISSFAVGRRPSPAPGMAGEPSLCRNPRIPRTRAHAALALDQP